MCQMLPTRFKSIYKVTITGPLEFQSFVKSQLGLVAQGCNISTKAGETGEVRSSRSSFSFLVSLEYPGLCEILSGVKRKERKTRKKSFVTSVISIPEIN